MPTSIDLKGIHFRTYSPQFDQDIEDGAYNPVGPGSADITPGGIDLSIIKFRAWQRNDIASDVNNNSDIGSGEDSGGGNENAGSSIDPRGITWLPDEITDSEASATITRISESISEPNQRNSVTGTIRLVETISGAVPEIETTSYSTTATITVVEVILTPVQETIDNSNIVTITISETIFTGEEIVYGEGNYGDGPYGGI